MGTVIQEPLPEWPKPEHNPWLQRFTVRDIDQYGNGIVEIHQHPMPLLYFWLGSDAYPEWPTVDRIECAPPPAFMHHYELFRHYLRYMTQE